jgi:hypothetical protein
MTYQREPNLVRQQLARLPWFGSLEDNSWEKHTYVVIDEKGRRELARGEGHIVEFNPQGNLLLTTDQLHEKCVLWDLPPRKPFAWFLALAAVLGMAVGLLARWRLRGEQPDSQKEATPALTVG